MDPHSPKSQIASQTRSMESPSRGIPARTVKSPKSPKRARSPRSPKRTYSPAAASNDDGELREGLLVPVVSQSFTESTPLPAHGDGYASVEAEKHKRSEYEGVGMEREGRWCNDWGFLLIFMACAGLLIGTGVKGLQDKYAQYDDFWKGEMRTCLDYTNEGPVQVDCDLLGHASEQWSRTQSDVLRAMCMLLPIGIGISALFILYMRLRTASLVKAVIMSEMLSLLLSMFMNAAVLNIPFAALYLALFLLKALFYWCFRGSLEFATVIIQLSIDTTVLMPGLYILSAINIVLQAGWCLLAYGSWFYLSTQSWGDNLQWLVVLTFYWGIHTLRNLQHTTTCAAVASWCYQESPDSSIGSLGRTLWHSAGSVCYGSLLTSSLAFAQYYYKKMNRNKEKHPFLFCCCLCCLGSCKVVIETFNSYAFVVVARDTKPYCEAARTTVGLVKDLGVVGVLNADLIDGVIENSSGLAAIVLAGVAGVLAIEEMDLGHWDDFWNILAIVIVGYILGLSLMAAATVTLEAAMATLLVCFSEHPAAFENRHPQVFGKLVGAWAKSDIGVPDWVSQANRRVCNNPTK